MHGYRLIVRGKDLGYFVNEAEAWGKAWLLDKNDHKEKGLPLGALIRRTNVLPEVGRHG